MPNASVITTKHGLIKSLRAVERITAHRVQDTARDKLRGAGCTGEPQAPDCLKQASPPPLLPTASFVPPTYLINLGTDKLELLQQLQQELRRPDRGRASGKVWIVKPVAANQGHGIFMTRDASLLLHDYLGTCMTQRAISRAARALMLPMVLPAPDTLSRPRVARVMPVTSISSEPPRGRRCCQHVANDGCSRCAHTIMMQAGVRANQRLLLSRPGGWVGASMKKRARMCTRWLRR